MNYIAFQNLVYTLIDTLPPKDGKIHTLRTAVTHGYCRFEEQYEDLDEVRVKNCGTFNVYYLKQLTFCDAAYCFGNCGHVL